MTDVILTAEQLAERWHCDLRRVNEMAARREIRGFKVGRGWRFRIDVVEAHEVAGGAVVVKEPSAVDFAAALKRRA